MSNTYKIGLSSLLVESTIQLFILRLSHEYPTTLIQPSPLKGEGDKREEVLSSFPRQSRDYSLFLVST